MARSSSIKWLCAALLALTVFARPARSMAQNNVAGFLANPCSGIGTFVTGSINICINPFTNELYYYGGVGTPGWQLLSGGGAGPTGPTGPTGPSGPPGSNGGISVRTYGAKCDGVTDDSTAFQNTINAACALEVAAAPGTLTPSVYIPTGNCVLAKPIIYTCGEFSNAGVSTMNMFGDSYLSAVLSPSSLGPAILVAASNQISQLSSGTGVITGAPAVTCAGCSSLVWGGSGSTGQWFLDLMEDLTSLNTNTTTPNPYLSGKSAATIRGFFYPTTTGNTNFIIDSAGTVDYSFVQSVTVAGGGASVTGGDFGVWTDTDQKLHGWFNTSINGIQKCISTGTYTQSAWNEFALQYDGADEGVALNGTWGTLVPATGTLVQRNDEPTALGAIMLWPHNSPAFYWQGSLFDYEIANVARYPGFSNYTPDTTPFTFDSHTIYGSADSQTQDMTGTLHTGAVSGWQPINFGADYFNGAAVTNVFASVHTVGLGCCGGQYNMSNLTIKGGGVGIDVANAAFSGEHLQLNNQTVMGINLSPSATFNSHLYDIRGQNGRMGMIVAEGGITDINVIHHFACGILCDFIAGGSFRDAYIAAQGGTLWPVILAGPGDYRNIDNDAENGGTCTGIIFETGNGQANNPFTLGASNITSCGGSGISPIWVENVNFQAPIIISGSALSWNGSPAAVVHQVGTPLQGGPEVLFENDTFGASAQIPAIPYTDSGNQFQAVGSALLKQTSVNGTSAGSYVWSEPIQSSSSIEVDVNLIGYENTTGTAQTITYPVPFSTVADIITAGGTSCSDASTTLTTFTQPSSMSGTQASRCKVVGY